MATSKPAPIEINLFGQKIVLKANADDPALVARVVELVTKKIKETEARTKGAAPHQISLLALMDMAAEYLMAKERTEQLQHEVDEKSSELLSWIETEFK